MTDATSARRVRYALVVAALVAASLAAAWYVETSALDERLLFFVPLVALVVAGIEWDRIVRLGFPV